MYRLTLEDYKRKLDKCIVSSKTLDQKEGRRIPLKITHIHPKAAFLATYTMPSIRQGKIGPFNDGPICILRDHTSDNLYMTGIDDIDYSIPEYGFIQYRDQAFYLFRQSRNSYKFSIGFRHDTHRVVVPNAVLGVSVNGARHNDRYLHLPISWMNSIQYIFNNHILSFNEIIEQINNFPDDSKNSFGYAITKNIGIIGNNTYNKNVCFVCHKIDTIGIYDRINGRFVIPNQLSEFSSELENIGIGIDYTSLREVRGYL